MLESNIEQYTTKIIKNKKGLCIKLNSTSLRGLPDRMVLLHKGVIFFIEFKAPNKKANQLQLSAHRVLKSLGFDVYVVDSKEKAKEVLKKYGI